MSELNSSKPPVAARKPVERRHHGDVFVDEYEWLRDKTDDEVLDNPYQYTDYKSESTHTARGSMFGADPTSG